MGCRARVRRQYPSLYRKNLTRPRIRFQRNLTVSDWLETIAEHLAAEKHFAVATIVRGAENVGAKMFIYPDGTHHGDLGDAALTARVIADAVQFIAHERSETCAYEDTHVFIETYTPPPRLLIVGGVHTAIPLSQFARILGFRVTVVDGRGRFATRERFPDVDELIVEWPDDAIPHLKMDESTYVVILTHDPKFDLPTLKALSTTKPRYIGAMGSRETRRQHMEELRAQGVPDEFLKTVYGPVGLDLGGRSPEEMALAIMAQIVAVRYHRRGGHLMNVAVE
jgi:xanthine dehydrogenase accessory factor